MPRGPHVRGWARWITAAASGFAALLVAELGLRILDLPRTNLEFLGIEESGTYRRDPELFWSLRPDASKANQLGLRGWLPDVARGPRDFRIALVGDSCTFGSGVRYEETYGVRLERMVQAEVPGMRVETMLAALPGYSTEQSRVLYQQHVAPRKPDLTVLYLGAWNDFVPALGKSDVERRVARGSLRLERLVGQRFDARDAESYRRAFDEGLAPDGRRVPLDAFERNVRYLIDEAKRIGSDVILVLPPLPGRTLENYPIAGEYRGILRKIAEEETITFLDAQELFSRFEAHCPEEWLPAEGGSLCFQDWMHPTALGHQLLARSLYQKMRRKVRELEGRIGSSRAELVLSSCSPEKVSALAGEEIAVEGRGFAREGAFDRVWLGGSWIEDVTVVDDGRLLLRVPVDLPPGRHVVEFVTRRGIVGGASLLVRPVGIEARLEIRQTGLELEVEGTGPPGWRLGWWLSPERRKKPAATSYGLFHLAAIDDGHTPGVPEAAFRFDKLGLLGRMTERVDAQGAWSVRMFLEPGGETPAHVFLQGVLVDPANVSRGAVTEVVKLDVPR